MDISMRAIAHIQSEFPTKFGVPRQSGLVPSLESTVVFTPEFRNSDALRGIEGFSHLWLIWVFDRSARETWSPTVRPPRLGGNQRMGIFATRSPFRPNPIGLSCVELAGIETTPTWGTVLRVRGADLADGSPDSGYQTLYSLRRQPSRRAGGLCLRSRPRRWRSVFPRISCSRFPHSGWKLCVACSAQDPRPRYQEDPQRVYGFGFAGMEINFPYPASG